MTRERKVDKKEEWKWVYDRGGNGQSRRKHLWGKDKADFKYYSGELVGKCPCSLSESPELLNELLNGAIPSEKVRNGSPIKLYNVYKGVVFQARQTIPGKSYHGHPWCAKSGDRIDPDIEDQLREKACEKECLNEYLSWMKRYGETK